MRKLTANLRYPVTQQVFASVSKTERYYLSSDLVAEANADAKLDDVVCPPPCRTAAAAAPMAAVAVPPSRFEMWDTMAGQNNKGTLTQATPNKMAD